MLSLKTNGTIGLVYPVLATATVAAVLLRGRTITDGSAPGSGATIAVGEILTRIPAVLSYIVSVTDNAFSLLLRISLAPAQLASTVLGSELRIGLDGAGRILFALHDVSAWIQQLF